MEKTIICQGRSIGPSELCLLSGIINDHPDWSRHRITKHICAQWGWRTYTGQLKTFAARSLIDKLDQQGLLRLPPIQANYRRCPRPLYPADFLIPQMHQIKGTLDCFTPLSVQIPIPGSYEDHCFGFYLKHYHYLGFTKTVGENLKYLIRDQQGRNLACLLFGSAAWKTAPRDSFIGWRTKVRECNINFLTNNVRFLILPGVHVPHLASHILGLITRRIKKDWIVRYAHPLHMVETFVESPRFKGTCYKAANWIWVGKTTGRSRQDRKRNLSVPIKEIWLYPLTRNFQKTLCDES
ncbi:MAG: hypothetical protein DRI70_06360 [Bacteroidetes bacterium]|nr:MAG: hypothetical protein DRI70_06360 [Bacteroidota bacterium]